MWPESLENHPHIPRITPSIILTNHFISQVGNWISAVSTSSLNAESIQSHSFIPLVTVSSSRCVSCGDYPLLKGCLSAYQPVSTINNTDGLHVYSPDLCLNTRESYDEFSVHLCQRRFSMDREIFRLFLVALGMRGSHPYMPMPFSFFEWIDLQSTLVRASSCPLHHTPRCIPHKPVRLQVPIPLVAQNPSRGLYIPSIEIGNTNSTNSLYTSFFRHIPPFML